MPNVTGLRQYWAVWDSVERRRLFCGRFAVCVGIVVFIVSYALILARLGLVLGIATGWLFSSALSVAATLVVYRLGEMWLCPRLHPR